MYFATPNQTEFINLRFKKVLNSNTVVRKTELIIIIDSERFGPRKVRICCPTETRPTFSSRSWMDLQDGSTVNACAAAESRKDCAPQVRARRECNSQVGKFHILTASSIGAGRELLNRVKEITVGRPKDPCPSYTFRTDAFFKKAETKTAI